MFSSFRNRFHSFRGGNPTRLQEDPSRPSRNEYTRPGFLKLTEAEYEASASHATRFIMTPKEASALPWNAGYAECVCLRKKKNEDQTAVGEIRLEHQLTPEQKSEHSIDKEVTVASLRGVYFGVFDGHGGAGAALMVADQLINHLQEKLVNVQKDLFNVALSERVKRPSEDASGDADRQTYRSKYDESHSSCDSITVDKLIIGALESAFHAMDEHILVEKATFDISGGCCTLVALFICGKLYVANAGDCRAVAYIKDEIIPLSTDFSADQDTERIYLLAQCCPQLLEGKFSLNRFQKTVKSGDIGKKLLCKAPLCSGWSYKEVTEQDFNCPLISMKGKESRLMRCIGISRCLGDHHLREDQHHVRVKPFLSCTPEVKILDLRDRPVSATDVLVMGSDGLWDTICNNRMGNLLKCCFDDEANNISFGYNKTAAKLVWRARGDFNPTNHRWETDDDTEPSFDDITAVVVPLHHVTESTVLALGGAAR